MICKQIYYACISPVVSDLFQLIGGRIGQYIYYRTRWNGKIYAAKILDQEDNEYATVQWYPGNIYANGEKPSKKAESNRIPIHRCAQAIVDRGHGYRGEKVCVYLVLDLLKHTDCLWQFGTLRWPVRLCDTAYELYNYTNPVIQTALEDAFHSIYEILTGKREHPIIESWGKDMKGQGIISPKRAVAWHETFNVSILDGDRSLITPLLDDLLKRLLQLPKGSFSEAVEGISIDSLFQGPGVMLFRLVILRVYLGREPQDDDEIYRLVAPSESKEEQPRYDIIRHLTTPEQALAARLRWRDTSMESVHEESTSPLEPHRSMVKIDASFHLPPDEPHVLVQARPGQPPFVWPAAQSGGLTGGPPYMQYGIQKVSSDGKPPQVPKPRMKLPAGIDSARVEERRVLRSSSSQVDK